MDEGTLNDLLECSVCLERLDTSSKVLPCQHTFCRKCLENIVGKHKELRCPECRVLVPIKVEELPPNVLLMRILEGMKNATPKVQQQNRGGTRGVQVPQQQQQIVATPDHRVGGGNKQSSQHSVQPYAKALYDYASETPGDLSFKRGETIILKKRIDHHWYQGECGGNQGAFPLCYVQIITPVPSHTPQCKALYDFRMTNDEEEGCLSFNKGDIFSVIRRVDENWAEGKLDGRIGIFPLAFVELNGLARSLMKLSTNTQPGPSKVAPPTPTTEDSSPLIPTDHTRIVSTVPVSRHNHVHLQQNPQFPSVGGLPTSDSSSTVSSSGSSSTTTTPNTSWSTTSSGSSTAPSSPASPPPRNTAVVPPRGATQKPDILQTNPNASTSQRNNLPPPPRPESHNREKRHSFTSLTVPHHTTNTHRHSAEILGTETEGQQQQQQQPVELPRRMVLVDSNGGGGGGGVQLPAAYIALYPYKPQKPDELELRKGGIYMVVERCQDGWFKGTSNRTQKTGVFPGNYVTLARGGQRSPQSSTTRENNTGGGHRNNNKNNVPSPRQGGGAPPELPPRSVSPATNTSNSISLSWHGQQDSVGVAIGRSSSANMATPHQGIKPSEKSKDAAAAPRSKEKGTVSLMRRLTSISNKRSKSPPLSSSYSMDNPVFEDSTTVASTTTATAATTVHPVHVRSGSCPSQLLQLQPPEQQQQQQHHHRIFASTSQRIKSKERPSLLMHSTPRPSEINSAITCLVQHHHRKSNSLDGNNSTRHYKTSSGGSFTVRERFRCIAPYPPNSEYELELQVNDIIYVHRKRDDGWYKGTQQRTGRTGLFPASFVESF